ncbi:MAG TPA: hypothetical protein PLQ93_06660, partial [Bacteroidia bacterium]|nr:hypothetical protein [Bacteroidia bacterium]
MFLTSIGQNQNSKWFFGYGAGLDFMSNPPTPVFGSSINVPEGCSSISDNNGNILFYSDGQTIWNQSHNVMANGTGLAGSGNPSQSCLIAKQPGSNTIYFVFTIAGAPALNGNFCYSIVDMSLAAGLGSVTVKNAILFTSISSSEKITGTMHCNGIDKWILTHGNGPNNNTFHAFYLSAAGLNTVSVNSAIGSYHTNFTAAGCMKISPNGRKVALAFTSSSMYVELFDFDNQTGVVSNSLVLNGPSGNIYGIEFSGDGSKLYASRIGNYFGTNIYQWDLCAGNNAAIISSF